MKPDHRTAARLRDLPDASWLAAYLYKSGLVTDGKPITDEILLAVPGEDWRRLRKAWRAVRYRRLHASADTPRKGRADVKPTGVGSVEPAALLQERIGELEDKLQQLLAKVSERNAEIARLRAEQDGCS